MTKPLDAFVKINDNWYNIEYEGLPEICYLYERYGHKRERYEMKGQPCGVMPGKTNMGKEANPVKDDNGMNKQNNDIVAPEVNDNSGTDSLKGPWMHVPPRRKPRNDGKHANGKGSTSKANGSRFDTLRQEFWKE